MRWVSVRIKFRFTRKDEALTSMFPHFAFSKDENAERRKWKYDDSKVDCAD